MERILLIEDIGVFSKLILATALNGRNVDVAHNVEEAQGLLAMQNYDIIFCDLGSKVDRRSKLMELTQVNCGTPLVILDEKPQDLCFGDRLRTIYSPVCEECKQDVSFLFQEKIDSVSRALTRYAKVEQSW